MKKRAAACRWPTTGTFAMTSRPKARSDGCMRCTNDKQTIDGREPVPTVDCVRPNQRARAERRGMSDRGDGSEGPSGWFESLLSPCWFCLANADQGSDRRDPEARFPPGWGHLQPAGSPESDDARARAHG